VLGFFQSERIIRKPPPNKVGASEKQRAGPARPKGVALVYCAPATACSALTGPELRRSNQPPT
jgi:hypothetical protein